MRSNAAKTTHPTPSSRPNPGLEPGVAEGSGSTPEISPLRDASRIAPVEMTLEENRLAHAKNFANELNKSELWKIKISYQKRWTARRRANKAVEIQITKPWQHSTGPKTAAGKRRSSLNALRGDPELLAVKSALRVQRRFLNAVSLLIRMRKSGHPGEKSFAAQCACLGKAATHALVNALMLCGYDYSFMIRKEIPA